MIRARWLLLVAGASLALHAYGLLAPPLDYHYHRQCNTAAIARNFHENGKGLFYPQIDWEGAYDGRAATEFPLYMWMTGLLWSAGGLGAAWGRIISALFSAATAVYLVLLLEKRLGSQPARWAGLLFTAIPLEIYFGRTVQPEAIALFCGVAALYHWERALAGGLAHWAAAVALAFLSFSHKLPYLHLLLPLLALALERWGAKAWTKPKVLLAPAAALAGVWAWYAYAGSGRYVVPAHRSEFLIMLEYARLPYFVFFQVFSRFIELVTTYGGLVFFAAGAWTLWKRRDLFLAAWFASGWIMLVGGGGYSFRHEYTSLPLVPVVAGAMGLGLCVLRERLPAAAVWLLAVSIPVHAGLRIKHWYGQNHPYLLEAAQAADGISSPQDLFICNERASSSFLFFLGRKGWSWDLAEVGADRLFWVDDKIKEGAAFFATAKANAPFPEYFSRYPVVYDKDGLLILRLRPALPASSPLR